MSALNLELYGDIMPESVRPLVDQLRLAPDSEVMLRINSPGGNVTDGFALANALRAHPGRKVAVIEGVCASAATFPACACDEVRMYAESLFMVHGPWGEVTGGPAEMATQGELLGKMADLCVGMYARKTGADEATVRQWMARDTWMKPEEAMAAGFCDEIITDAPTPKARADAQRYLARLRTAKRTKGKAMASLPEHLSKKLAQYMEGDDDGAMQRAFATYMEMTEEGPEARREMARAMEGIKKVEGPQDPGERPDNPVTTSRAKAADEEEVSETDKGEKMKAKLRTNAGLDPAVQKLVADLTSAQQAQARELEALKAERRAREVADYHAYAKDRVSKADADEYLTLCGNDVTKARAIVAKYPAKASLQRVTVGGAPIGAALASATESEAAPTVRTGRGPAILHGYALSKAARASLGDKKPTFEELAKAQISQARSRPDQWA